MQDERELTVELERERGGEEIAPIRVAPDDLEPDTLRAVIESFVLREGTDYGVHERRPAGAAEGALLKSALPRVIEHLRSAVSPRKESTR